MKRCSVEEAHQYFHKAFSLINSISEKTLETYEITVDLLNRWALVYYYKGSYKELGALLFSQESLIDQINDKEKIGMFYAWQGNVLWIRGQYEKAEKYLLKAEKIGIEIASKKIIGYACAWLTWIYGDMGQFDRGLEYGKKANEIGKSFEDDSYIYFKSLAGICWNHFWMGHAEKCIRQGDELSQFGDKFFQNRSLGMGYTYKGGGYLNSGNFVKAISTMKQAISIDVDPFYSLGFRTMTVLGYIQNGDMESANDIIQGCLPFSNEYGCEIFGDINNLFYGIVLIDKGKMSEGLKIIKNTEQLFLQQQRRGALPIVKIILAKIYFEIIQGTKKMNFFSIIKNIGFIIKNIPFADQKAIGYYSQTIEMAEEIGSIGFKAQAHLDLGIIHRIKNRKNQAKEHLEKAIHIFEKIGAFSFLKQANRELNKLN